MFQKKDVVFGFILTYLFLIMLYFVFEEKEKIDYPCSWGKPCVRFCCDDSSACEEKYIRENFNESFFEIDEDYRNETEPFRILTGQPKCSHKLIDSNDSDVEWEFSYVRKFFSIAFQFNF